MRPNFSQKWETYSSIFSAVFYICNADVPNPAGFDTLKDQKDPLEKYSRVFIIFTNSVCNQFRREFVHKSRNTPCVYQELHSTFPDYLSVNGMSWERYDEKECPRRKVHATNTNGPWHHALLCISASTSTWQTGEQAYVMKHGREKHIRPVYVESMAWSVFMAISAPWLVSWLPFSIRMENEMLNDVIVSHSLGKLLKDTRSTPGTCLDTCNSVDAHK